MYDAIVVGARCAGSPAAMLLARAGYRVLLLDRGTFPSDTLSTHLIHQPGVARLADWGLLEAVRATGCPPLDRATYQVADIRLDGCARGVDGQRSGFAPRRHVLDTLLVDAAVAAGAELREECRVVDLSYDDTGRVAGVKINHNGRIYGESTRLVVGADGMRSTIARLVRAPFFVRDHRLTCAYYSYWDELPVLGLELYESPGRWVAAVPTNDRATLVLTYFPQARFDEIRGDAERAHLEQVRLGAPALYERLSNRRRVEKLRGTGDQQNFMRRAAGRGWALVGDAGHHKDSITARGMSDAFYQVDSLVRHIGEDLDGDPDRLDRRLHDFEQDRNEALTPGYESTLSVAKLAAPHADRLALLRAVASDAELTSIYFDMVAGICGPRALYTPKLLELLAAQ